MSKIDFESKSCVTCKHDLLENRDTDFLCEERVANDEYGDFIQNPLTFYCSLYQQKNRIEDTAIKKGLCDGRVRI